jgi:uncharacterized protein YdeI (YjbR/CyaY-like superfamily)
MPTTDPRFDAYIAKSPEFARPILEELRARVHAACPEAEETLKWSAPSFTYKGKLLAVMAAFKQHVAFNLWHGAKVVADDAKAAEGMGQFGRITSVKDIPAKRVMTGYIRDAMKLIDAGETKGGTKVAKPKPSVVPPDDLLAALAKSPKAKATFEAFPPGKKRDYVDWIVDAKRAETRQRRLIQAVEWMAEGKARHWKYENC